MTFFHQGNFFPKVGRGLSCPLLWTVPFVRDIKHSWMLTQKCALMCLNFSNRNRIIGPHLVSTLLFHLLLPQHNSWIDNCFSTLYVFCVFNIDYLEGTLIKDFEPAGCWSTNHTTWAQSSKCYNPNISQEANMHIWGEPKFWPLLVRAIWTKWAKYDQLCIYSKSSAN